MALLRDVDAPPARAPDRILDSAVLVAVVDPSPEHTAAIADAVGRPVVATVTTPGLERALDSAYKATGEVGSQVQAFELRDSLRREAEQLETAQVNEDAPVVRVVQMVITQGLRDRASDIHIEPSGDRVRVRPDRRRAARRPRPARVDRAGDREPGQDPRRDEHRRAAPAAGRSDRDGRRGPRGRHPGVDHRGRRWREGRAAAARQEPRRSTSSSSSACPRHPRPYSSLIRAPYGMVICAGPTGSGKTTTLYASLGELNTPDATS